MKANTPLICSLQAVKRHPPLRKYFMEGKPSHINLQEGNPISSGLRARKVSWVCMQTSSPQHSSREKAFITSYTPRYERPAYRYHRSDYSGDPLFEGHLCRDWKCSATGLVGHSFHRKWPTSMRINVLHGKRQPSFRKGYS